jgi:hypothetical protein
MLLDGNLVPLPSYLLETQYTPSVQIKIGGPLKGRIMGRSKGGSEVVYYRIGDLMVIRTLKYDEQGNCVSDEEKQVTDPKQLELPYTLRNHIVFTNKKDINGHLEMPKEA